MKMKITDMMDNIRDDTVPVQIQDIASTERIKEAAMKKIHEAQNRSPRKTARIFFVAAVLVAAFFASAFAIYQLSKEDYRGSSPMPTQSGAVTVDEERNIITESPVKTVATMLDIPKGAPKYEAAQEWQKRRQELSSNTWNPENPDLENPDYWGYNEVGAYNQEARDIVGEILAKYNLKLPQRYQSAQSLEEFYEIVGVSGFMPKAGDSEKHPVYPVGFGYHGGAHFNAIGIAQLPDGRDYLYRFNSSQKDIFECCFVNICRDVDDYEWWSYVRKDGIEVLLCMEKDTSFMHAVLDNAYISVLICSGTENSVETNSDAASFARGMPTVDKATLEELAECFDFTVINSLAE